MNEGRLLEALKIIIQQTANWQAGLGAHPSGLLQSINAVASSAVSDAEKVESEPSHSKSQLKSKA